MNDTERKDVGGSGAPELIVRPAWTAYAVLAGPWGLLLVLWTYLWLTKPGPNSGVAVAMLLCALLISSTWVTRHRVEVFADHVEVHAGFGRAVRVARRDIRKTSLEVASDQRGIPVLMLRIEHGASQELLDIRTKVYSRNALRQLTDLLGRSSN